MSNVDTIVLSASVGALVSLIVDPIVAWAKSKLTRQREQRQYLWEEKREQIRNVERYAGFVSEQISGDALQQDSKKSVLDALTSIEVEKHILRRHEKLRSAIHDFVQSANSVINTHGLPVNKKNPKQKIENKYDSLISACDIALQKDRF